MGVINGFDIIRRTYSINGEFGKHISVGNKYVHRIPTRLSNEMQITRKGLCLIYTEPIQYETDRVQLRFSTPCDLEPLMRKIDNKKDILLLLLYSPGKTDRMNEPVTGRTRMVKMLYLFRKEALKHFVRGTQINEENFYEFYPWDFGPFSSQVYDDIMFFILQDFIETSLSEEPPLPESEAEWDKWLSAAGTDIDEETIGEYYDEMFSLTPKGIKFTKEMYDQLSSSQQKHLREFKKRSVSCPLRALLQYVYSNYPEDITHSKIKDQILGSARF